MLTIKSKTIHISRKEFEYDIPLQDAKSLLGLCHQPLIEKVRHELMYKGLLWEIDEFFGKNEGLIIAEVELESEEQDIEIPSWIGDEVSFDVKYFNASLVQKPYCKW